VKLACLVAGVAICATAGADVGGPRALPVTEMQLANGLRVILAPDPSVSSVVVDVRYGTGAADEAENQAGLAHVVERLLFEGSTHVSDFDARIDAAGGWSSSVTTEDHTSVYEQVPAGALELALWLEAERMAGLPGAIDDARVIHARAAIAAERRSAYEDHPSALVARAVQRSLWADEPNAHLVLGEASASVRDVATFARAMLAPSNATLVIAGRFEPHATDAIVRRYFAWIPGSTHVPHSDRAIAPLRKAIEVTVEDPIVKVVVAVRTGAPYAAETLDLEVAAQLLAGGRTSRLWQRLVEGGLATEVHADVIRQTRGGELRIQATPRGEIDPARLGAEIRDELARLRDHGASADEIARATTTIEAQLVSGLEDLTFRAETLAASSGYPTRANDVDVLRSNLRAVSPSSLQVTVTRWLAPTAFVTVIGRPR
jgi:zinc protease